MDADGAEPVSRQRAVKASVTHTYIQTYVMPVTQKGAG